MTELLSGIFHSHLGRSPFDGMPDQSDQQWRQQHQYYNGVPMLSGWQQSQPEQMPGIDVSNMFARDTQDYQPYCGAGHATMPPAYHHDNWASDMDMGTPNTAGFANEAAEPFQQITQPFGHLRIPANRARPHSPSSSHSGISPQVPAAHLEAERPGYGRSLTDPSQKRRATAPAAARAKQTSSDEDDEDFIPAPEEAAKSGGGKGRKRQRIPHTAVERRYRENLNAHLDKLRQTVPSLAPRKGPGKEGEGVRPSKCEILSGAIDHIGAMDRENAALKNEVRALRQQVGEYEAWYRR